MRAILLYPGEHAESGKRVRVMPVDGRFVHRGWVAVRHGFKAFQVPWWHLHALDNDAEQVKQRARFEELRP